MNNKILNKYKNKNLSPKFILQDGGVVIGSEVDENNQLHYVIERGNNISIEKVSGSNNMPIIRFPVDGKKSITVDTSSQK